MIRVEDGLAESIIFQRQLIRAMNTTLPENCHRRSSEDHGPMRCLIRGPGVYCMADPTTGKALTYGEFFDRHAMTMQVIKEVVDRTNRKAEACPTIGPST